MILSKVDGLIERIDEHGASEVEELSIEDIDVESDEFNDFLVGAKIKVLLQDVDRIRWKQDLQEDRDILTALLREAQQVDSQRDEKLRRLKQLIRTKVDAPPNAGNRKVLVFTAFADTAAYLYENLAAWAKQEHGLHSAMVTGGSGKSKTQTNLEGVRTDIGSILTAFSPISKERDNSSPPTASPRGKIFRIATISSTTTSTGIRFGSSSVLDASTDSAQKTRPFNL